MFVWVGIDVESQLKEIKEKVVNISKQVNFNNSACMLPLHISLKISFKIDDNIFDDVLKTISDYYNQIDPFDIEVEGIEKHTQIIWIKVKRNKEIDKIHDDLNTMLLNKYNIGLHEYDLDYKFHSTLFMDSDKELLQKAGDLLGEVELPKKLRINTFLIGTSDTGQLGTYYVYKEFERE